MTEFEMKLIRVIRESEDPAKTIEMITDMVCRIIAGEDVESIAASYGLVMDASGKFAKA